MDIERYANHISEETSFNERGLNEIKQQESTLFMEIDKTLKMFQALCEWEMEQINGPSHGFQPTQLKQLNDILGYYIATEPRAPFIDSTSPTLQKPVCGAPEYERVFTGNLRSSK